jgi:hypothetical protein
VDLEVLAEHLADVRIVVDEQNAGASDSCGHRVCPAEQFTIGGAGQALP